MFQAVSTALALSLAGAHAPRPGGNAGNVVVIVIDDIGVDLIGAYDSFYVSQGRAPGTPAVTPAIDQLLAAQGLTFANAWSLPSCSPSRAQMLTGRYPFRTGVGSTLKDGTPTPAANPGLSLDETLAPELMRIAGGYTSAAVGKWHIADLAQLALDPRHPLGSPPGRWFDRYAGSLFNLSRPAAPNMSLGIYSDWRKDYSSELVPGLNPCGVGQPPCTVAVSCPSAPCYATVDTADDALAAVASLPEPWFLWVAFNAAHEPVGHAIPSTLPTASCSGYVPSTQPCAGGTNALDKRCVVAALDTQIGRLVCALDASDTTVILVGDNGTDVASTLPPYDPSHGKGTMFEGGIQVPLIVRSPLLPAHRVGDVSRALVSTVDLHATLVELAAGAPGATQAEDSVSLAPYIRGQVRSIRKRLYAERFEPNFTPDPQTGAAPANYFCERQSQALRMKRFKLIRRWSRSHQNPQLISFEDSLFDLWHGGPGGAADPYEQHDLLVTGVMPGSLAARALAQLQLELDTQFPTLVR